MEPFIQQDKGRFFSFLIVNTQLSVSLYITNWVQHDESTELIFYLNCFDITCGFVAII